MLTTFRWMHHVRFMTVSPWEGVSAYSVRSDVFEDISRPFYSTDFRDSTILIPVSLRYMTRLTRTPKNRVIPSDDKNVRPLT